MSGTSGPAPGEFAAPVGEPVPLPTPTLSTGSSPIEPPAPESPRRNPWRFVGLAMVLVGAAVTAFAVLSDDPEAADTAASSPTSAAPAATIATADRASDVEAEVAPVTEPNGPADTTASEPETPPATEPTPEPESDADPGPEPGSEPEPEAAPEPEAEPGAEAETPAPAGEVPESKATIRNGQIFFEGAVPTQEQGDEIVGLAIDILGPDNVINNYVVDPRAGDPSDGNITVEDPINFNTDSAEILPSADTLLGQGLALMTVRPAMTVTIVGHTDSRGSEESNLALSIVRAESVKQWFVDRGIDPARLSVRGAGELEPIASNDTVDGRSQNRRIQFFLENVLSG